MSRKRKKKCKDINPDDLAPGIAAGFTQGISKQEALEQFPVTSTASSVSHMKEQKDQRIPSPRFVARESERADVVTTYPDGRTFRDSALVYPPDVLRAMRAGYICFRCQEPQSSAFADDHLEGCEGVSISGPTYMKDRQIMDIAMEMEGEVHLGPSKPISEYLLEQDLRVEKRKFDQKVRGVVMPSGVRPS